MALTLNSTRLYPFQRLRFSSPLQFLPPNFLSIHPKIPKLGFRLQTSTLTRAAGSDERGRIMAARVAVKEKIDLTEREDRIFNRLLDVLKHFELDTQLRVAGGWVRDKVRFALSLLFQLLPISRTLIRSNSCFWIWKEKLFWRVEVCSILVLTASRKKKMQIAWRMQILEVLLDGFIWTFILKYDFLGAIMF